MLFHTMFTTRPSTKKQAAKFSKDANQTRYRPQLEMLEDRVVPSVADGAVLVCSAPSFFSTQDQTSYPTGIIAVDPSTGEQAAVSTGGLFSLPTYIAEGSDGMLYVTDLGQLDSTGNPLPNTGAVIKVDPNGVNGANQSLLVSGLNGPNAITIVNGLLYVANLGDSTGLVHEIVQIDPITGQEHILPQDGGEGFSVPTGITAGPGNNIYVADEPGNVQGADPGAIWEVNLDTGKQTLITHGGLLDHPSDLAVAPNGDLLVGNTGNAGNSYAASVVRVNPQTGEQTLVASFGSDTGLDSLDVGTDGTIYVGAISFGATPGKIYAVDPGTGSEGTLTADANISLVEGIRVFHAVTNVTDTVAVAQTVDLTDSSVIDSQITSSDHLNGIHRGGEDTLTPSGLPATVKTQAGMDAGGKALTADHVTALFSLDGSDVGANHASLESAGGMAF